MKVYLDTNILSRIPDLRLSDWDAQAYASLPQVPGLKLVTSQKTKQEIANTQNRIRFSVLNFLYSLFEKTPWETFEDSGALGVAPLGVTPLGAAWSDPLYGELKSIFDEDDAQHIFQAVRADCDYFLTLDRASILDRVEKNRERLRQLCPKLEFGSPQDLVARFGGASS